LEIIKTVNQQNVVVGSEVIFTLTVTNLGPSLATNVIAADTLQSGFNYVSDNGNGAYNPATGLWTIGDLDSGSTVVLNITATVNASGIYTNIASILGDEPDDDTTNNQDTVIVNIVDFADLEIEKTVDNSVGLVGSSVVFTLTVTNNGPGDATNVEVIDTLPSGYIYVSDNGNGTYISNTGLWTVGTLDSGEVKSLEITVTINSTGDYLNTATVSSDQIDTIADNSIDSALVEVITDVEIPEGFSPNGDGINENFIILGIEAYPNNQILILNRWGNKVFDAKPYNNEWSGKNMYGIGVGGDDLPEGTYFYILDLGNGSKPIKGYIYLKR
jgi:gliding motility-associated-like protein/uncharacterized repeat protein (TIGR01451 family)